MGGPRFRGFKGFKRFRGEGGQPLRGWRLWPPAAAGCVKGGATALWAEGGGIALRAMSFIIPLRGMEKPYNRAFGAWKCTPIPASQDFPRRGKFALLSASEFISISKHSAARISPSGGDVAAGDRRGCARHGCNLMGESPKCGMTITSTQPMARGPS